MRSRWAPVAVLACALVCAAPGWRIDGTSSATSAKLPSALAADTEVWRAPMPAWTNASPVEVGGLILTQAEPTWLIALDAATGKERWRGRHDYLDTLEGEAYKAFQREIEAQQADEALLRSVRADLSAARREARSSTSSDAVQVRIAELSRTAADTAVRIEARSIYFTPDDLEIIGYSSATPATDGKTIVALFGNGVISAWTLSGKRLWSRWLGPAFRPMKGYDAGATSSPAILDDVVIVPFGKLTALDLATGEVRWTGDDWPHYGSPAVTKVGSLGVVLTPDGKALSTSDGRVLATGLGDLWYIGPFVRGDVAYYVGNFSDAYATGNIHGRAWRLTQTGAQTLQASALWSVPIPDVESAVYAAPATDGRHLYLAARKGDIVVLDALTGAATARVDASPTMLQWIYANPVVTSNSWLVSSEGGVLATSPLGPTFKLTRLASFDDNFRSTPLPSGDRLYVRLRDAMVCFGP